MFDVCTLELPRSFRGHRHNACAAEAAALPCPCPCPTPKGDIACCLVLVTWHSCDATQEYQSQAQRWGNPNHSVSNLYSEVGVQVPAVNPALRSLQNKARPNHIRLLNRLGQPPPIGGFSGRLFRHQRDSMRYLPTQSIVCSRARR